MIFFLELINFFADFNDHVFEIAKPLHKVVVGTEFNRKKRRRRRLVLMTVIADWDNSWGARQCRAWRDLNAVLSDLDFLSAPRQGASKKSVSDSSPCGIEVDLLQVKDSQKWHPLAVTSRKLTYAQRKFTVTKSGCLAVVHGLRKWKYYLHSEKDVVMITAHCSLNCLMSVRDPRGRLAR